MDARAEAAALTVFERLAREGGRFSLLSEEMGVRDYGAEFPRVLLDPVDGSLNAKQGLPVFATMLSLAEGETVDSVRIANVTNLVSGQCWEAVRGHGALLSGRALQPLSSAWSGRIECLGLESSPRSLACAGSLVARAGKLRILGSMALSLCHAAAGGMDVFCCPIEGRVFDMTASLLILRESGGVATDLEGRPVDSLAVGLESRTTLLAASNPDVHTGALAALRAEVGTAVR